MLAAVDEAMLATWEELSVAAAGQDIVRPAAVAPYLAARAYQLAAIDSAQLHGGIGVTNEFPLHRYFQRAQGCRLRIGSMEEILEGICAAVL